MINVYCISGLGADERIFEKLNIQNVNLVNLSWPQYNKNDTLGSYAIKVSELIKENNPILLGVSFGGMLAVEIAKQRTIKRAIIISSAKTQKELPYFPFILKSIIVSGLIPSFIYKWPNWILYKLFGVETRTEKQLLRSIVLDSNAKFVKWASTEILKWQNDIVPENATHIHGRKDRIIFPGNVHVDYWIEDGGHMMIFNRAEQISRIIEKELKEL